MIGKRYSLRRGKIILLRKADVFYNNLQTKQKKKKLKNLRFNIPFWKKVMSLPYFKSQWHVLHLAP